MKNQNTRSVSESKARKFFEGAAYYQQVDEYALSMFMLQQAAETTFRTIAIALYGSEPRTHSIRSLKVFNRRLAPQLNDLFPDNTAEEEQLLNVLEDAYLAARYTSSYQIGRPDLDTIFVRVAQLLELSGVAFEEKMKMVVAG